MDTTVFDHWFQYHGGLQAIDWCLLKAQVKAESSFDPLAVSKVGAKGLAQFMSATWEWAKTKGWIPTTADPFDPAMSIQAQAHYTSWLLTKFNGDETKALAAYNWGIGNVRRVISDHGEGWLWHCPEETINYVAKINRYYDEYTAEVAA